jgi:hypothetical protein
LSFDEVAGIEVALKAVPPELSHNTVDTGRTSSALTPTAKTGKMPNRVMF